MIPAPAASPELARLCVNTLKFLAVDAIEAANSGHPGLPMGAADLAFVLWSRFLRHDPADPHWPDRDRFLLSPGHGSMLLYGLLHLSGYDLPLDELKRFRQWGRRPRGTPRCTSPRASRSPPGRSGRASPTAWAWPSRRRWPRRASPGSSPTGCGPWSPTAT